MPKDEAVFYSTFNEFFYLLISDGLTSNEREEKDKKIKQLEEIIHVIKFNVNLERKRAVEEFSKLLLANFREDESCTLIDRATVASIEKSVLKEV